jgi:hypothetical protein
MDLSSPGKSQRDEVGWRTGHGARFLALSISAAEMEEEEQVDLRFVHMEDLEVEMSLSEQWHCSVRGSRGRGRVTAR